jgi:hypothetical protein
MDYDSAKDGRKHPPAAFWATVVVVVLLVAYPLSFGPACWLYNWNGVGKSTIEVAYFPLVWISQRIGIEDLTAQYATRGRRPAVFPFIADDGHLRWGVDLPQRER